ncbi:MAG: gliding motility-associated C-terminal domain-containing protein [Flavobacteriales bacterium]|jgi:gliding motility-associated-like protein|nr:gliding motility-associated C-terminal domain-containing protein [Flavobacteriales bacterium]
MKIGSIRTALFIMAVHLAPLVWSQASSCPNSGFDNGDFTNWSGGTGYCCPINVGNTMIAAGRHTIMTGPGTDPNTDGAITVVAPGGGTYSARLGNDNVNSQAERLTYAMVVDASNALFVYRYAVVLEDPSHSPNEQPRFEIRMFDQSGTSIDCGVYNVYSSAGIPGFVTITNQYGSVVNYKDWTTVGMDLSAYIGQTVTIEFATGDCSLGAHYGYAYIDCYCSPLSISSDFCPGSSTTTLTAPVGFASYQWSTGETTSSIVVNAPATGDSYDCVLTSVTGCTATISTTLTPSIVASGYGQVGDCMNAVQFTDNSMVTSGPPITSWHWDFGDGHTSNIPSPFHSYDTPGDHEVQLIVDSDAGCPDTLVQTITLIPAPVVAITHNAPCFGEPLELHDATTSGTPMISRLWDFGDGSPTSTDTDPVHDYAAQGNYDITLIVTGANGCEDTLVTPITVSPIPVVNLGPDAALCEADPWPLDAGNAGMTYLWNTGAQTQLLSPTVTGVYTVEVTSGAGCVGRDTVSLVFDPLPAITIQDTTVCIENPLVLNAANPGCTYLWSTGETTQSITVPTVSDDYSVTVTTAGGCSRTMTAAVTIAPSVALDLGPDQGRCIGEVVELDPGTFPGATYLWSTGSPFQVATFADDALVWLYLTNGYCTASDTVQLLFDPPPVVDLPDTTLCAANTLVLDAGNPGATYLWSTGETTQTISLNDISGTVDVTVTSPVGCARSDNALVTFIPEVSVDLGPDQVHCDGEVAVLDAGAAPNATYAWSSGGIGQMEEFTSSAFVQVLVQNSHCQAVDSVNILFNPLPVPTLADTTICVEQQLTLDAGNPGSTYLWSTGATTRTITLTNAPGSYDVTVTTPQGCSRTSTIQAVFMPSIMLELGPDSVLCEGDVLTLDAGEPGPFYQWSTGSHERFVDISANADVWVRVSNGYCAERDSISLTFIPYPEHAPVLMLDTCFEDPRAMVTLLGSTSGTLFDWSTGEVTRDIQVRDYGNYVVAATNPPRCTTVDTIRVMEYCPPRVFLPNTFTPNNDGANDRFAPVNYNVISVELAVFDRWGEVVFLSKEANGAWDGTIGGKPAPIGVYTWRYIYDPLLVDGSLADRETIYGHVTVLR